MSTPLEWGCSSRRPLAEPAVYTLTAASSPEVALSMLSQGSAGGVGLSCVVRPSSVTPRTGLVLFIREAPASVEGPHRPMSEPQDSELLLGKREGSRRGAGGGWGRRPRQTLGWRGGEREGRRGGME